ncbi:YraN family protein [Patescibacteria group bacterium]|nr:YraN family protein [Patescibacteria group bacterium]MBU2219706.1 YraN family protein [Patescibacteria group bacterium]MBU2264661.1 YraN family protein [Patescibacteria group bacterium]
MKTNKRQFGDKGEEAAVNFLREKGYKIIERNYARPKYGEIDIVAAKMEGLIFAKTAVLVFAEVKTIKGGGTDLTVALAAQNVHYYKQQRLIRTAKIYLIDKKIPASTPWRIDVILVVLSLGGDLVKIEHLENAVWGR